MWILDIAWRNLIEYWLKNTDIWKNIVNDVMPYVQPTPHEGLSFWGNTLQPSAQYQSSQQENAKALNTLDTIKSYSHNNPEIVSKAQDYMTPNYTLDDALNNMHSFLIPWTLDSKKAGEYKDALFSSTVWNKLGQDLIKKGVSTNAYEDFQFFRRRVTEARSNLGKQEGMIDAFSTWQAKWIPFGETAVDTLSKWASYLWGWAAGWLNSERLPSFSEREQAKQEAQAQWEYDTNWVARFAGTIQWALTWYWVYWKVVDKALLGTKVPWFAQWAQTALRESYSKNPFLFNLTSNSAQNAIEYGVRKWLWDDNYSVSDLALWLVTWGIAAKIFSKPLGSIFDNINQKDLNVIEEWVKKAKTLNPEVTWTEIFDSIKDTKLSNGMTFGTLKESFINAGGKLHDAITTTPESLVNYFRSAGTNISTWAGKKITNMLDEINWMIGKKVDDTIGSSVQDIRMFKQDVLKELNGSSFITMDDVEKVLATKTKEYGIKLSNNTHKVDIFDEAEEAIGKNGAQISNLANPKTLQWFKYTYLGKEDYDVSKLNKLQEEIDNLSSVTPTLKRLQTIDDNKKAIKWMLQEAGYKSIHDMENARFRIDDSYISAIAKEARTIWTKGKVTNEEKSVVRDRIIEETKQAEAEAEKLVIKMGKTTSINKQWDFAKIIQFTQLKNWMQNTKDYLWTLRTFINVNKNAVKWDIWAAVEAGGGKVFNPTTRELKKFKLNTEEDIVNYAKTNWFDGANIKRADGTEDFKLLNDKYKGIDATKYWVSNKSIQKMRTDSDINQITSEANIQREWKFHLADDEEASLLKQTWNTITLKKWVWLSYVESYQRQFEKVFGIDSHAYKIVFQNVDDARGNWVKENISFQGKARELWINAWLEDTQTRRKYVIHMTTRQWGVSDRITEANNLRIDGKWNIWDTSIDKNLPKDWLRKLDESDIASISKQIDWDRKFTWLTTYLDNTFNDGASRLNRMVYDDLGKLIPTEKKYFPIYYNNANYYKTWEETKYSMKAMWSDHIQQWFLNQRKAPPSSFSIDLDFANVIKSYGDRQLYFLHMKSPVMMAKRAIVWANRWVGRDDISDFVTNANWEVALRDLGADGWTTILSPKMKWYFDDYITRVENRWVIPTSQWLLARIVQNMGTFATIAYNPWSALAQPFSIIDSITNTSIKNVGLGVRTLMTDFYKWGNRSAFKYSWALLERQTERVSGLAQRWDSLLAKIPILGRLSQKDIKVLSDAKWNDNILGNLNEVGLRLMRRVDWEVSYSVWHGYMYDYVSKNFPDIKLSRDVEDIRTQMKDDNAFMNAVHYADSNMSSVMGGASAFTHWSKSQELWVFYKAGTMIQRTFLNRMLFLNHNLSEGWLAMIPRVSIVLGLNEWMETEREYARQEYYGLTGRKKFNETWSHIGNILANNPSLQYDNELAKIINTASKDLWVPLTKEQLIGARAFLRFAGNNIWSPWSGYEISSMSSWISKWWSKKDKNEDAPANRSQIELAEAVAKTIAPNIGDDWVDLLHKLLLNEPLWKTVEDNYELGKKMKTNPELEANINKLDFKAQGEFAQKASDVYKIQKEQSAINKEAKLPLKKFEKKVEKQFNWTPTREDLVKYIGENIVEAKAAWIKDDKSFNSFYSSLSPKSELKNTPDEYGALATVTDGMAIYKASKLQALAKSKDKKWFEDELDKLVSYGIIKSKVWFMKRIDSQVRNDILGK